jgi:hypothetical protein
MDFDFAGKGLLVADESAFPGSSTCNPAAGGCGGLIAVNPLFGDQAAFSPPQGGSARYFRDPIDVAVDRRGGRPPLKEEREPGCGKAGQPRCKPKVEYVRSFSHTADTEYVGAGGLEGIRFFPLKGFEGKRSKVALKCLSPACPKGRGPAKAKGDEIAFTYDGELLKGKFRVVSWVPIKQRNPKLVYRGRYKTYSFTPGGFDQRIELLRSGGGCLEPGTGKVIEKGKRKTEVPCPSARG